MLAKRERETHFSRVVMLVDMNAFFAQIEQVQNPHFKGKPVLVSGSSSPRTVVTAASYEAKKFGIKSGLIIPEAKRLCPEAVIVEGNQEKYIDYSKRLVEICKRFTDLVEPFSIDEAFLDVTGSQGLFGSPENIAKQIKSAIRKELGLTCSVGVAENKLLAKMASEFQKPDGLTIFYPDQVPQVIWHLPVEKLFGVGEKMKEHLNKMSITTIGELANFPVEVLKIKFGKYGEMLHMFANGVDHSPVDPNSHFIIKSMGNSYTLPFDVSKSETIKWFIYYLSDKVARRLRKECLAGRTITLVVRDSDFYTYAKSFTIEEPTNIPQTIASTAWKMFTENFSHCRKVRLLGVSVSNLSSSQIIQLTLFSNRLKIIRTYSAVDKIKDKYGDEAIIFARLCSDKERKMIRKKVGCFLTKVQKLYK